MDVSSGQLIAADFLQAYLGQGGYAKLLSLPPRPPTKEMLQRWPNALCYRAISRRPASRIGRLLGLAETIVLVVTEEAQGEVVIARRGFWWPRSDVLLRWQLTPSEDMRRWKIEPESALSRPRPRAA
jgi:hypothetical protein